MKPQTKETAILMLVDSIEAASRTIEPPEREKFEEMIQRIIFTKLRSGPARRERAHASPTSVRWSRRMSDTLVNMFHHRIRYPWQEQRRRTERGPRRPGATTRAGAKPSGRQKLDERRQAPDRSRASRRHQVEHAVVVPSLPAPLSCNRAAAPSTAREF